MFFALGTQAGKKLRSRTLKTNSKTLKRLVESVAEAEKTVEAIAAIRIRLAATMASTGAPVVTGVTEDGAAVVVEIALTDIGIVIATAVAAVGAGKGAVGVEKREVTVQNTWMSVTEDGATIKKAAARDEAEALMAKTTRQNMLPTRLPLRLYLMN